MKKLLTIAAVFTGIISFAQEAGKTGELLKNEANSKEMQVQRTDSFQKTNSRDQKGNGKNNNTTSGYRNPSRNTGTERNNQRYNWNQNYGYSEVFLRIPEYGYFTVEIGNQSITNDSGKFRFFDLNSGRMPISIYENGYLIYRTQLNVKNDNRVVLDFFTNYGLYLLDSYPVRGQMYGFNEWDDVWNNPYANGNGHGNCDSGNNYGSKVMDSRTFDNFLRTMDKTASFDKDKVAFINQQSTLNYFTSKQIKALLDAFSFDEQRLQAAKILYPRCTDVTNFYIVYESFDFDKGKKDLMNYISGLR